MTELRYYEFASDPYENIEQEILNLEEEAAYAAMQKDYDNLRNILDKVKRLYFFCQEHLEEMK